MLCPSCVYEDVGSPGEKLPFSALVANGSKAQGLTLLKFNQALMLESRQSTRTAYCRLSSPPQDAAMRPVEAVIGA